MQVDLGKPNAKQDLFLRDRHRHVAFGGARGGGKSWAVRTKACLLASRFPGIQMMIVRKTYPELKANHIRPLKKLLGIGTKGCLVRYNDSEKLMTFPNGSTILFAYCDTEADTDRYQGTEIHVLFLDEATQLSQKQIEDLNACVRSTDVDMPLRTYYTCNPGGKGHAYIKRLFVDRIFVGKEKPEQYSFIQSLVYDNQILLEAHPEYLDALENLSEAKRKAWLLGDWNSFVGQAFPEFRHDPAHYQDRQWTHVIDNLQEIPPDWKIYRGFDFGYRKPFAVVWIGIQPATNRMYLFKEWYGCTDTPNTGIELSAQEIADGITVREKTDPRLKGRQIYGIADKAIWIKDGAGESIAEMMEQRRVYFEPSDSARLAGKMQMHYRLRFDEMGLPMFYVCKECEAFIRTFPLLLYDEKKTEDIDTELEDHEYDAVRYVAMDHPLNPAPVMLPDMPADDPLNMWSQPKYHNRGGLYG